MKCTRFNPDIYTASVLSLLFDKFRSVRTITVGSRAGQFTCRRLRPQRQRRRPAPGIGCRPAGGCCPGSREGARRPGLRRPSRRTVRPSAGASRRRCGRKRPRTVPNGGCCRSARWAGPMLVENTLFVL